MASMPDLSRLLLPSAAFVPTGAGTTRYPNRNRAFIYVVADMLGDEDLSDDPLLLLVRHNYTAARNVYGVPGGLQDNDDLTMYGNLSLRAAAKREFAEEVLNLEGKSSADQHKEAVAQFVAMTDHNDIEELERIGSTDPSSTHTTGLFRMRVPRTSVFEERAAQWNQAVNPAAGVDVKRITTLSSEMIGYAWVRRSAIRAAVANPVLDRWGNLQVRDTDGGALSVRDMVLGSYQPSADTWTMSSVCDKLFDFVTAFKTAF